MMTMTNAEYATWDFTRAATRFMKAYGRSYWESFGNNFKEVVKCAPENDQKQLRATLLEMRILTTLMLQEMNKP